MANRGYDVVIDVDNEGDLGHTDLQDDLEFHSSNFEATPNARGSKIPSDLPAPNTTSSTTTTPSPSSKRFLWSLPFYAQFFDIDTTDILTRCTSTLYPRRNFLDVLDGNPDLYGPFWIATTVVVILFLSGTINGYLSAAKGVRFAYDFRLLSGAAGLMYGYTALVPLGVWGVLRWFGSESANLLECLALYGYANIIWIPVAVVSWSPISAINYAVVGVGFAVSAAFLCRNLWPVLSATDGKTQRVLLGVVVVLHAGLAVAIKVLFFAHGSPAKKKHDDDDKVRMLFGL